MNTEELTTAVAALDWKALGREAYKAQQAILEREWREWLFREHLDGFALGAGDIIFRKAWSDGHASGYYDVANHYEELAELVKEVLRG